MLSGVLAAGVASLRVLGVVCVLGVLGVVWVLAAVRLFGIVRVLAAMCVKRTLVPDGRRTVAKLAGDHG